MTATPGAAAPAGRSIAADRIGGVEMSSVGGNAGQTAAGVPARPGALVVKLGPDGVTRFSERGFHHSPDHHHPKGNPMSNNSISATSAEVATPDTDSSLVDGQTTPPDAEVDDGDGPDGAERGAASREAAKYRRQLRDAEAQRDQISAERDQLGERLAAMQRREAEALAREHLADGADVWRDGLEPSAVLDDDGNLDPAKVTAAAKAARKAHPHWAAPQPQKRNPSRRGSFVSGASGRGLHEVSTASWQQVLNNRLGDD